MRGRRPRGVVVQQLPALESERRVPPRRGGQHQGNCVVPVEAQPLLDEIHHHEAQAVITAPCCHLASILFFLRKIVKREIKIC